VDSLKDCLSDSNPMVVANAVAALSEIAESSGRDDVFTVSTAHMHFPLGGLGSCPANSVVGVKQYPEQASCGSE